MCILDGLGKCMTPEFLRIQNCIEKGINGSNPVVYMPCIYFLYNFLNFFHLSKIT